MFFTLRTRVDAVLVGTGTLRDRALRAHGARPARQEQRAPRLEPEPLAIVCSRRGDFPDRLPLFTDPRARHPHPHRRRRPGEALRRAHEEHGVRSVLCEGGPTLNGALFAEGVVDELFLTISPLIADGPAPLTIVEGPGPETARPPRARLAARGGRDALLPLRGRARGLTLGGASWLTSGSHSSHCGRYQFQSPSSFIAAGSRTARTIVASMRTAAARPTPICFMSMNVSVPKIENTATMTTAALVTTSTPSS